MVVVSSIDKLSAETLTNETNYIKHISKVLDYFKLSPDALMEIYIYEDADFTSNVLFCEEYDGQTVIINLDNVSMLELPFIDVENRLIEKENKFL